MSNCVRVLSCLVIAAHVLLGVASVQAQAAKPAGRVISVATARAVPGTLPIYVETVGTLAGDEESTISAKVEGRVVAVQADLGDSVEPGGVLATLDPTDFRILIEQRKSALTETLASLGLTEIPPVEFDPTKVPTVQRAEVQRANAQARMERARKLFTEEPPLISAQDFADIETQYGVAVRDYDVAVLQARATLATAKARQADVAAAEQQLADATIRAPLLQGSPAGGPVVRRWSVARRMANIGDLARPGTELFQLVLDDTVKLRAASPERFVSVVKVGQKATVTVEGSSRVHQGVVTRLSPVVERDSRTFQVEIELDNGERLLRPGAFARARIQTGERNDVVRLPAAALQQFAGVSRVFSVGADGKAKAHTVTPLASDEPGELVVAASEIAASEVAGGDALYAVTSVAQLADGMEVKATQ